MFANADEMLAAIAEDDFEGPDLMSWKTWQAWRAHEGRRPAVRRGDAVSTTIAEESTMWKLVMEGVHGPDWRTELGKFNLDAGLPEISPLLVKGRQTVLQRPAMALRLLQPDRVLAVVRIMLTLPPAAVLALRNCADGYWLILTQSRKLCQSFARGSIGSRQ